jgi:translation elongation factor EF-Tu-like GTPase
VTKTTIEFTEIEAVVRFSSPEEGGRKVPIWSGYRATVDFGLKDDLTGQRMFNDCILTLPGGENVAPGEEAVVRLRPLHPDILAGVVHRGHTFELWEGGTIARGEVTAILG